MIIVIVVLIAAVVLVSVVVLGSSVRIVEQFERGVVFRFGRVVEGTTRGVSIQVWA
jgi:regulator of protease activity HflC (stomatin/prohibitin superfamily)